MTALQRFASIWHEFDDEGRLAFSVISWMCLWFSFFCILSHFLPMVGENDSMWLTVPYWIVTMAFTVFGGFAVVFYVDEYLQDIYREYRDS